MGFGRTERPQDDLVPAASLVENNPRCDVHELARQGLLVVGTRATVGDGEERGGYRLAIPEPGILEIDSQPLRLGWHRALPLRTFVCPTCNRDCYRLHRVSERWACRKCHRLDYSSRHRHRSIPGFNRAIYLRRRLGVDPQPFAPIAPQPLRRRRWWKLLLELRAIDGRLVEHLRQDVRAVLERRDGKSSRS
jgi:hypothetical protein